MLTRGGRCWVVLALLGRAGSWRALLCCADWRAVLGSCWLVVVFIGSCWPVAGTAAVVLTRGGHCWVVLALLARAGSWRALLCCTGWRAVLGSRWLVGVTSGSCWPVAVTPLSFQLIVGTVELCWLRMDTAGSRWLVVGVVGLCWLVAGTARSRCLVAVTAVVLLFRGGHCWVVLARGGHWCVVLARDCHCCGRAG